MDSTEKQNRYEKWRALVLEQEKSGLSQADFCKKKNLILSQFGYYRSVIQSKEQTDPPKPGFSPVSIQRPHQPVGASEIKILLPNGMQCILPGTMDAPHIKRLMEALLSC